MPDQNNLVSPAAAAATIPAQDEKQKRFLEAYKDINRKQEEDKTASEAVAQGFEYINLSGFPIDLQAMALISEEDSKAMQAVVFYKEGLDVRIAALDPKNPAVLAFAKTLQDKKLRPKIYYISKTSYQQTQELYSKVARPKAVESEVLKITPGTVYSKQLEVLANPPAELPATKIIEILLGAAIELRASDIHVEPEELFVKVRFRVDGVLQDVVHIPKAVQRMIISRLKIISKLKLNVNDVPQDGRFSFDLKGALTDVRVSMLPSAYGEGVVMRLLVAQAKTLELTELGMNEPTFKIIQRELAKPNGMIVTTGPTGSGKTTTLYAFLNFLNTSGVKIITLEDPVEYKLEGISQTPIATDKGMTFAIGLRSILRQDPDVIMVGEIRDQETAEVALQAALTGHVVLSTLHTNDAAGAIPRLSNMGVKPYTIAPGMNAIIAQRLVRKLCPDCKQETKLDPFMMTQVKEILSAIPKNSGVIVPAEGEWKFYHSTGCDKCGKSGYHGRVGIYEVIAKTDAIEKMIFAEANASDIKKSAIADGMITMAQDGMLKVLSGVTDVEEVLRVAQE
jgi:type IV pilus assembly protein PilB